ncbi:hypothetical protein EVAR_26559_1 [Eumeta japonica]|uniref:Uncharacterized protein n=1 Tax=Eumeta variegata TaxID=151549 RepID=A0A4C1W7F9_EUMVA|nr:hypothetical protein EVAR_26559_1 [Eumeta japonica]
MGQLGYDKKMGQLNHTPTDYRREGIASLLCFVQRLKVPVAHSPSISDGSHPRSPLENAVKIALWRRHSPRAGGSQAAGERGNNSVDREFRFNNKMTQL